jgi:hypothetical protein
VDSGSMEESSESLMSEMFTTLATDTYSFLSDFFLESCLAFLSLRYFSLVVHSCSKWSAEPKLKHFRGLLEALLENLSTSCDWVPFSVCWRACYSWHVRISCYLCSVTSLFLSKLRNADSRVVKSMRLLFPCLSMYMLVLALYSELFSL